jgi:shikimate dehydrogenase
LPYKEQAYALAAIKSTSCEDAGAANTLWLKDNMIHADNTDGIGLLRDLERQVQLSDTTILLLGAGGAARGIVGALLSAQPKQIIMSNRTIEKAYKLQQRFPQLSICPYKDLVDRYDIIINATSASLDHKHLPLPLSVFSTQPFCYDLAYAKKKPTAFVQWAETQGCPAKDGLGMLIEQAAEAFYRWHGVKPDTAPLLVPGALF